MKKNSITESKPVCTYLVNNVLWVCCAGSFLPLRQLFVLRSLDILMSTSFLFVHFCKHLRFSGEGALLDFIVTVRREFLP